MRQTLLPDDPVARALTYSTMGFALANGVFYTVSTLYFTRVVGLAPTTVGLGLGIAGGVGVASAYGAGRLADRVGAHRVLLWGTTVMALAMLAYQLAASAVVFTAIACLAVGGRAANGSARSAILAVWYTGPDRVDVRARLRVVTNVFIGLGTVVAGAALLIDTAAAYHVAMAAVGGLLLLATVPVALLPRRVPELVARLTASARLALADGGGAAGDEGGGVPADGGGAAPGTQADAGTRRAVRGPSPLRDRTYVASVACNAVVALHFGLQTVGVPLWIASTEAPTVMVSVLLVLNTVLVALFQVRAARGTDDVRFAGITVRRASWLLAFACLAYALAGYGSVVVACVLLVVAGLAHTAGEVLGEGGGWGMAFELADPRSAGAYQGLSQTGYAVASMVSPVLVTATAIDHGSAGWAVLGVVFLAGGAGAAAVAGHAARTRTAPDAPGPVAQVTAPATR
ncbi:MFS transporter [Xylanimonas cellulosilytica]|uniref:MFS transporter n=1 Tax=Xylanimonas cellulosilytica TaxID=186189 RepID=UPI00019C07D8|nr:MFS transporter [Xylanimonas cellulosilytica]